MVHHDFDRSAFSDPATGGFRFPKYASLPGSLVRITDRTKYSSELWSGMGYTAEEKRRYDISRFEEDLESLTPEIDVEGFETLFKPRNKKFLGPLDFLSGNYELVDNIGFALAPNGENVPFVADRPAHKVLIEQQVLVPVQDRSEYLNFFRATDLKPFAKTAGIKVGVKKDELISEMISRGVETNLPPVVRVGPAAKDFLDRLCKLYLDDIEGTTILWHPLVRCAVWEAVAEEAEIEVVARAAKDRMRELGNCP